MTGPSAPSTTPNLADGPPPDAPDLLGLMWRIRLFENEVKGLFARSLVRGSTHLCQGQEATVVGVCTALIPGDTMTCTYRGHGAVLAMGAPLDKCFGEILGRSGGLCRGRAWLDALRRRGAGSARRKCDRGGEPADHRGGGAVRAIPPHRRGERGVFR